MLLKLLALFTIVPLIELALLIPLGMQIGLWPTIALVVATAVLGAVLSKLEGSRALAKIKDDLNNGRLPGDSLLDGLAVLIAGVCLVTPGVLTDIAAIILLIPPARKPLRAYAKKRFKKMLASDSVNVVSSNSFSPFGSPSMADESDNGGARPFQRSPFGGSDDDIIDVTPSADDDEATQRASESIDESEHVGS